MNLITVTTNEQLEEVYRVRKIVFVDEQHVPLEEEIDNLEEESTHFLLQDEEQSVGAGRFRVVDSYGKVERICVLKHKRKSGAGRAIMEGIEAFAKKEGIKKLKLNAQTHAIPFYEGLGYKVASEEFLDAGIPHKTMIKQL
ncbi:GNAT family N-acetyltransferase [Robertmurraya sp. DFI.2.37]|uniref:GNAT family N-acetyltransferase n=1 Tax=Robertmurraya sp. DFI.2.37 TaxID=3031819 RepID=UPI0012454F1D|nr:GNAT family N-acetyltransferase [Robertmurraya sp. DFI.2.37]MDF1507482.1 GNAT family N-acetyltransferase [Robertmurraya sp. DFI.2.37]